MKLSKHFRLKEFEHSGTALALGINNQIQTPQPPKGGENAIVENLKNLCEKVLEPLREWYGGPIRISSGYRCPELNTAVGGVKNSQHMTGEAADIVPLYYKDIKERNNILKEWCEWIQDNLRFDQLILERKSKDNNSWWIHVSLCRDDSKNRQMCIVR